MAGRAFVPRHTDVIIGQMICNWRKKLGLSQKDLADAIGVSFQQVQKYETAGNRISVSRLYDIARVMQIPISAFFTEVRNISTLYDKQTYQIIQRLLRMSDTDKQLVANFVNRLVD